MDVQKPTLLSWMTGEHIEFKNYESRQRYRERTQRIVDTIELRVADRVPFWFQDLGYFPCKHVGISKKKANYDATAWLEANRKTLLDYEPDMFFNPGSTLRTSGQTYEALDTRYMKWPGHGISPDAPHQYVEGEYMKADEYEAFLSDPSDYIVRTFLPRQYGKLSGFSLLPPLSFLMRGLPAISEIFLLPELRSSFEAIRLAAIEAEKWNRPAAAFLKEMNGLGFPVLIGAGGSIPFDLFSDRMRGMRGSMLDMYRRPDKLLAAMEKVLPLSIAEAVGGAKRTGNPGVFIAAHRGSDGFMSKQQFETFYWPGFKKLITALVEEGLVPCVFFEGNCTSRLDYLASLPKGKILGFFENTDIYQAKEELGDVMAMSGFMPLSLLQVGTPEQVREHTKLLVDVLGTNGGFIMGPKSVMDEADPDLVRVWIAATREYGLYKKGE
jgi:hypothetical protein